MHELSIALNLVEIAETALRESALSYVVAVHLRLGIFSGIVKESLLFAYEIASENTVLAGSRLVIEDLPLIIYCPVCQAEQQLHSIQLLECPICGRATNDIRQGKEIEIDFLELSDETEIA